MHGKVLAVDDDAGVLCTIEEALNPDIELRSAACGSIALERLAEECPDAVIVDYRLPDMTGDVLIRRIRESHPDLPLILLTVVTDVDCVVRLFREGPLDYLPKPFDAAELRAVVERAVGKTRRDAVTFCESLLGMGATSSSPRNAGSA
jgi:two-component system nitrogen regulation response regulator GlnG